ncbi:glycosyltransferase family 4 protein [Acidisphaera rubrifaciens]|uniref:Glycosyl transferase n=1 Tax=Acidisphaera rubrifaciens HS-AP3 TaxID=1231350 RepID=A0A0D6P8Z2_9PROT|nr:glycosyltransferase family 4 protein [Acidisphaera rubrifaciens]GAN77663.1 glycosyl transferase [Acidisphaera rubrifaciens HS-AP3]
MRILYSHRIQSRDGQSVHVDELIAALRAAGHEVLVVGPSAYAAAEFGGESRAVAFVRRVLPRAVGELAEIAYNLPAYRRLHRAHAAFRPDLIYERYNLFYVAGARLARRTGTPLYVEVNSPLADERARFGGLRLTAVARAMERHVWQSARRVLTVTQVLRAHVVRAGTPAKRVFVTPNGVVPDRYAAPMTARTDAVTLGFVGFVRDWHGLDSVLAAIAAHRGPPRITLTVVGDGPARPALMRQAAALGIADRLIFTGTVAHADVPALVGGFDVALQPRVVAYASPLKIFDYMAAGRAIVAPDQPNIREVLRHEGTALLFDPASPASMWASVLRLVADAPLRERLGRAARAELLARDYTWSGNARRIAAWARQDIGRGADIAPAAAAPALQPNSSA